MNQVLLAQNTPVAQPAAAPALSPPAASPVPTVAPAPLAKTVTPTSVPAVAPPVAGAAAAAAPQTTATVAQGQPQPPQGPQGALAIFTHPMFLLVIMFVVFYFLLIRPQQKKQKAHQKLIGELKKGDDIILSTGMFGKIAGLNDTVATIEIADKVRVKVLRSQIAGLAPTAGAAQQAMASSPAPASEQK